MLPVQNLKSFVWIFRSHIWSHIHKQAFPKLPLNRENKLPDVLSLHCQDPRLAHFPPILRCLIQAILYFEVIMYTVASILNCTFISNYKLIMRIFDYLIHCFIAGALHSNVHHRVCQGAPHIEFQWQIIDSLWIWRSMEKKHLQIMILVGSNLPDVLPQYHLKIAYQLTLGSFS